MPPPQEGVLFWAMWMLKKGIVSDKEGATRLWLGRQDSNLGMAGSKPAALPLGYAPTEQLLSAISPVLLFAQ
jgi:hypothetical protein